MRPLSSVNLRIIGVLIEKSLTTPEQYPLSLNSLVNGCNQKSNRDPVLDLRESEVQHALAELVDLGLVTEVSGFGSRVIKYQHRFCNTEFSELQLTEQELALVCVLLLRGAQTPGELRTRSARLAEWRGGLDVEKALQQLLSRPQGALVERLPREPGRRESRYRHLFGDGESAGQGAMAESPTPARPAAPPADLHSDDLSTRVAALERQVAELWELLDANTAGDP